ncbi:MAG TPA: CotH kinase family protein [Anaerolineaceae bacterium]|nr:CotH kinase family protein [Anaerolineaceae bacterium]
MINLSHRKHFPIAFTILLGINFAISAGLRYTNFFLSSRADKTITLGIMFLVSFILILLFVTPFLKKLFSGLDKTRLKRIQLLSALVTAVIMISFYRLPDFPKEMSLEIYPSDAGSNPITLTSMSRYDPPRNIVVPVKLTNLRYEGDWQVTGNDLTYVPAAGTRSVISYKSYVTGNISLTFLTGPEQGTVDISLNDQIQTIKLTEDEPGTREITLSIPNQWANADQIRKVLLAIGIFADVTSLLLILVLFLLLMDLCFVQKKIKVRGGLSLSGLVIISLVILGLSSQFQKVVVFPDAVLEKEIRTMTNRPEGKLYTYQLLTIVNLDLRGKGVESLDGIDSLRNLRTLNLSGIRVNDLSPLQKLAKLQRLDLSNNLLEDASVISALVSLEELVIRQNLIEDLSFLEKLKNLKVLDIANNRIVDIEPLKNLPHLEELNLRENLVTDISSLAELSNLTYLNLHSNYGISDISPLANMKQLRTLILRNIPVEEQVYLLTEFIHLQHLNLRNCGINTIHPLIMLFEKNALQNHQQEGTHAYLNILENPLLNVDDNSYQGLRHYWFNITYRYPYTIHSEKSEVSGPIFSHKSGFYSQGFRLSLTAEDEGARIFYTLDGSEPSVSAQNQPALTTFEFIAPVVVDSRENDPIQFANILTSRLNTFIPDRSMFKATIVRAVVLDKDGNLSPVLSNSYFVAEDIEKRFSLPVVSLISPPDGLFSDEVGIYVPGDLYAVTSPRDARWNQANYTQRGLVWERPAHFQLFDTRGDMLLEQDLGIRVHGGASRSAAQKSLRLYADSIYGNDELIQFDFFPQLSGRVSEDRIQTFSTLILRTGGGGDWDVTMVRDVLGQSLLENTRLDIQGSYPVLVFIDGEYWGIHNIRTRYDYKYFEEYYGILPDELTAYSTGHIYRFLGERSEDNLYRDMLKEIDENYETNGFITVGKLADAQAYKRIGELMDIENYVDYNISQIYANKLDWPSGNILYWRKKTTNNQAGDTTRYGHDGRWRWMVIDMDICFTNPSGNTLAHATQEGVQATYLLRSLLQNPEFKRSFISRFADLLNTNFDEDVVLEKIDMVEGTYSPEIPEHIHRWGNLGGSMESWQANLDEVRDFARIRPELQRQQLVDYFGLAGTARLNLETDPQQGYVQVNSLVIEKDAIGVDDPKDWSGIYFKGVPVTLSAVPREGYRFSHWEGLTGGQAKESEVVLDLTGDLTLTAVFVP